MKVYVVFGNWREVRGIYQSKKQALARGKELGDAENAKRQWGDLSDHFTVHVYEVDKDQDWSTWDAPIRRDEPIARFDAELKPGEFETCSEMK